MNRHAWREVRRQVRESGAAGLVVVLLVALATALGGVLWAVRSWVDRQLLPGERPSTVVAVIQPPGAAALVWEAVGQRFPGLAGGPVAPSAVREQLGEWFPEFSSLFAGLTEESFPALVELDAPPDIDPSIVEWLSQRPEVSLVESSRRWQERLDQAAWRILWTGMAVAIALLVGCGALVLLVVRLLVLDHADEIAIMRLIGAHEREIRLPYVLCGTILGFLGGSLGVATLASAGLIAGRFVPGFVVAPAVLAGLPIIGAGTAAVGAILGLASLPAEP